ncbi:MAG: hypothetical protein WD030_06880 [Pirellulales bacterium]
MRQTYRFTIFLADSPELTDDLAEALFEAGCDDSNPQQVCGRTRIIFNREAESLDSAVTSAIRNVNDAGFQVDRLEMDSDDVATLTRLG